MRQNNTNELYHYGILGMKWGQRRFQNKDGSLTPAGKKRYDDDPSNDVDREAYEKERIARVKSQILDADDPAALYKNRDLFTTQELQDAYRRLNTEKLIKDMVPKETSKAEKFIKSTSKWTGDISTMINNGVNLYNNVQKVRGLLDADKKDAGGKKKNKAADNDSDSVKDTVDTAKQVFSKMDKNPITDVAKGVMSKYTTMDTASIKPQPSSGKSVSDYASYGKKSSGTKSSTSGVLSKYSTMKLSSIDPSSTKSGSATVQDILANFDYKFTDKKKK